MAAELEHLCNTQDVVSVNKAELSKIKKSFIHEMQELFDYHPFYINFVINMTCQYLRACVNDNQRKFAR